MKKHTTILLMLLLSVFVGHTQTNRPQEPTPPFNYLSENVFFANSLANNIKLAGTLSLPKNIKNPPVAILISGSGPQNRDEEAFNHKPFLVIADYLTNNGIAVLRYDDRGINESEGDFKTATTFDFASDVEAAINYLKSRTDIDTSKIGLIGHSEGGLVAPIVASKSKDVAFLISLAGTGVPGDKVLLSQSWEIAKISGATNETLKFNQDLTSKVYNVIKKERSVDSTKVEIKNALENYKVSLGVSPYAPFINDQLINKLALIADNIWMTTFIITDPEAYWSKVKCPVLAINGSKDLQVLPELNLKAIKTALHKASNNDITVKEIEGLNHLFQTTQTGNPNEYGSIEETCAPIALKMIKNWILERF